MDYSDSTNRADNKILGMLNFNPGDFSFDSVVFVSKVIEVGLVYSSAEADPEESPRKEDNKMLGRLSSGSGNLVSNGVVLMYFITPRLGEFAEALWWLTRLGVLTSLRLNEKVVLIRREAGRRGDVYKIH